MSCHRLLNRNGSCQTYIIYDGGGGRGGYIVFFDYVRRGTTRKQAYMIQVIAKLSPSPS